MRILTFTSLFPNASQHDFGIFVYQRVAALGQRPEIQIEVIAPVPYFPPWIPIARWRTFCKIPKVETVGSQTVYHPRYPMLPRIMPLHGLLMWLGTIFLGRLLHRRHHFDCVDAHYIYPDGFAAVLLGRTLGIPVFVSARGTDINVFPKFRVIRPMIQWTLRQATGIVAVSAALKQVMVGMGVPADKIRVIANGIDLERFHPVEQTSARGELGIPKGVQVIVSVGSLVAAKSHTHLISAVARLRARNEQAPLLYIVGEGEQRIRLTALIEQLNLQEQVFLVGSRPNDSLKNWFSAADVSCLASSREGMPNVVLESLACGVPVVGTRVGGVPEVLTSQGLGILVEPNVDSIADGLERALKTKWERDLIARYARKRTWDAVAEEIEDYFSTSGGGRHYGPLRPSEPTL